LQLRIPKSYTIQHLHPTLYHGTVLFLGLSLLLRLLRNHILVPFLFLPSIFLTRTQEHRRYMDHERSKVSTLCGDRITFFKLYTPDGAVLDAVEILHPENVRYLKNHIDEKSNKGNNCWLLWVNPNGGAYEHILEFLNKYSLEVGMSVLAFNYRGVGRSTGAPRVAADLVVDAETAFKYLIDQGVSSDKILIHGHSMGGGVGVEVRAKHPDGPIINDRSFSSLNDTVQSLVTREPFLGALLGGVIGFFLVGFAGGIATQCALNGALYGGLGAVVLGYIGTRHTKMLVPLISSALSLIGWHLHVSKCWKIIEGYKVVIYHQLDGLISHHRASLYNAIAVDSTTEKSGGQTSTNYVSLNYQYVENGRPIMHEHQMYHVFPLDTDPKDWKLIVNEAKRGLHII